MMKVISSDVHNRLSKIVQKQKFVKEIFEMIFEKQGRVLLVGGAVRDLLLQRDCYDLDFEVYGINLDELQSILEHFGTVKLVGKSFGVLRLYNLDIDWSLPRKDSSGRHPIVHYDPDMSYEDAFIRRDLTINAMGIDMKSYELIDLFGGYQDLKNRLLKAPDVNFFTQDPLRFFRVMQFCSRFDMQVDQALSDVCKKMDITGVSTERIYQEFKKMFLLSERPAHGLRWLDAIGRFQELFGFQLTQELELQLNRCAFEVTGKQRLLYSWVLILLYAVDVTLLKQYFYVDGDYKKTCLKLLRQFNGDKSFMNDVILLSWIVRLLQIRNDDYTLHWVAQWLSPNYAYVDIVLLLSMTYKQDDVQKIIMKINNLGIMNAAVAPLLTGKDFLNDVVDHKDIGNLVRKSLELQILQNYTDKDLLKKDALADYKLSK